MSTPYPDIEGQLYTTGAPDATYTEAEARQRAATAREVASAASAAGASALADAKTYTDQKVTGFATTVAMNAADALTLSNAKAYADEQVAEIDPLPPGGSDGQVLTRTSSGAAWESVDPGDQLPDGGTAGQVLTKTAAGEAWQSVTQNVVTNWSKDQQAKVQGYWIVVSPTEPESPTYETADGTVVPVIWQRPIERTVPVLPQTPAFSRESSSLTVPDLVGVAYRLTGWSTDGGDTWTSISDDLVGGAVTDVETATGQALPVTVRVEAFAEPGYVLPKAYKWTFDYPDPNATVIVTSDAFATDVADMHTRMSDAALGGSPKMWNAVHGGTPIVSIVSGKLVPAGGQGFVWLEVGAFNQEVEFDLSYPEGTNTLPDNVLILFIGAEKKWNGGHSVTPRYALPGHYKASIVGTTLRVTHPDGKITTTTDVVRNPDQVHISLNVWSAGKGRAFLDNLVVKQVGY